MNFEEILDQAMAMLQRRGRVPYRIFQVEFNLEDNALEALKDELIYGQQVARDEDGRVLVWMDSADTPLSSAQHPSQLALHADKTSQSVPSPSVPLTPDAEIRQLTVMFCDLVDSTKLSGELSLDDYKAVILAYRDTCAEAIQRFDGRIGNYLGDGLLVYFGYPQAHEDDAKRAVHTGLRIIEDMEQLNRRSRQDQGIQLAVRLGIHTGLVVAGVIGAGATRESLGILGETPNIAARLQGVAEPNTVVISATTYRLVEGFFVCCNLGPHTLKGVETPIQVYRVLRESGVQSQLDVTALRGLTPLVGREHEVGLLYDRWQHVRDGMGQVMLLHGEAGIGKSRLVQVLTEHVMAVGAPRIMLRCSSYHTNSALYPILVHLQQVLHLQREDGPEIRLAKLEQGLRAAGVPLMEAVPLMAALLAVPVPDRYPPLSLSAQRQKQKTQEVLVAWLLAEAAQHPILAVLEDLHWADPSTLELLGLLIEQVSAARVLLVLTARLEFRPPWPPRSYLTPLTLTRLTPPQVEEMALVRLSLRVDPI